MDITIGKTYAALDIKEGQTLLTFEDGFNTPLLPGSIPTSIKQIRFNPEFNQDLEPGVITDSITDLILGKGFKRTLAPGSVPASTNLLVHNCNRRFAPTDRPFCLYKDMSAGLIKITADERAQWDFENCERIVSQQHRDPSSPQYCIPKQFMRIIAGVFLWVSCLITPNPSGYAATCLRKQYMQIGEQIMSQNPRTVSQEKYDKLEQKYRGLCARIASLNAEMAKSLEEINNSEY